MEYFNSILLVISLFLLGVVSPGPNFLALTNQSLNKGFKMGVVTGLGIAVGDLIYASIGLFGMNSLIDVMGSFFGFVKLIGGLYLVYLGYRMIRNRNKEIGGDGTKESSMSNFKAFRFGLLTDLANPKTVIFFAGIFAATITPQMPAWVLWMMLAGIGCTSVVWRIGVSFFFSRNVLRKQYGRFKKSIEFIFGALLILLGVKLSTDTFTSKIFRK